MGEIAYPELVKSLRSIATFLLTFAALIGGAVRTARAQANAAGAADDPAVTVGELEAALTPYGSWTDVPGCGKAWQPDPAVVGDDFDPYVSNGQWLNSPYGWTFNSNESWGWAAFHFGRWFFVADQGWLWTVDAMTPVWAPAAVDWRTGAGVVGWLPSPPPGVAVDARQYATLWNVVQLSRFQRTDLARQLLPAERAAFLRAAPPPAVGAPVAPLTTWRGYPGLRAVLAAQNSARLAIPFASGSNPMLWLGTGSSVHAPMGMGQVAGASALWTGPGSSVFASPSFGESMGLSSAPSFSARPVPRGSFVVPGRSGGASARSR